MPYHSLRLIKDAGVSKDAKIIDIGGGDSNLVDHLLDEGYTNITVLDISGAALSRAQERLEDRAGQVTWIESDINDFSPSQDYDLWHDRAAFHFLTEEEQIGRYVEMVSSHVTDHLVMATFSTEGPLRCSALDISQYSADSMSTLFDERFELVESFTDDHTTPFDTTQNFLYCRMTKK